MPSPPFEQRNVYKGEPARAWIRLQLLSADDRVHEFEFLVDTGNPCAIIIDTATMRSVRWRESIVTDSNVGPLAGGWLRIAIPELAFDGKTLGYANDAVVNVVKRSDPAFAGLVGFPSLRMLKYGGDDGWFWIRPSAEQ
jgi:hypothetical protein